MTQKYHIITDDKVDTDITASSSNPVKSSTLYTALAGKLDSKNYASTLENYVPMVTKKGSAAPYTYELEMKAIPAAANADWTQTDTGAVDYIKNKPFVAVGAGLKVEDITVGSVTTPTIMADFSFKFQIFSTLPAPSADYKSTIALIAIDPAQTGDNIYEEFVCVGTGTAPSIVWKWEKLGQMDFTLSQEAEKITINGTDLNTATKDRCGILSKSDWVTFNGKQAEISAKTATGAAVVAMTGTAGTVQELAVDTTAATGSSNLITSGGVYTAVDAKQNTIAKKTSASIAAVVAMTDTAGTVEELQIDTAPTENSTHLITSGAVYTSAGGKVPFATGSSSTAFTIGKDSNGYYIEE